MDPCVQVRELALKVCRIGLPRQPVHPGGGVALEHEERLSEQIDLRWWKSAVNFAFFLCLAAFRTRASAWVTRARPCVRCVLCLPAFLLVPALGSTGSATGRPALFVGFAATMAVSDFPRRASSASAPRLPDADQSSAPYQRCRPAVGPPGSRTR